MGNTQGNVSNSTRYARTTKGRDGNRMARGAEDRTKQKAW